MKKGKEFKHNNLNKLRKNGVEMTEYKTYAQAVRNRKSDEITIYDAINGVYRNIKIIKRKGGFFLW